MTERRLGRTDIRVTPIGVGCWQFSGGKGRIGRYWPAMPQEMVNDIMWAALEGGVGWFDTAEAYGGGRSEGALATALATARDLGATIIAYSPLAQGLLSGKFHDDPKRVQRLGGPRSMQSAFQPGGLARSAAVVAELKMIAAVHGVTPSQVTLCWLVQAHGETVVAIPGASNPRQARDNAAALDLELTEAEVHALGRISQPFR